MSLIAVILYIQCCFQISLDDFTYLTRIHYKAPSDSLWGEHEIDYILFVQKDISINANPNEVMAYKFVSKQELKDLLRDGRENRVKITPWFRMICERFLFKWWEGLGDLSSFVDTSTIHKMT